MSRPKKPFKYDEELQKEILHDRIIGCLTIREISEKYQQYSIVTYKRFLRMVLTREESLEITHKARMRLRKVYSEKQKELRRRRLS